MKEVKCWTVAIGQMPSMFARRKVKKSAKEAIAYISEQEGFIGFHPVFGRGTLCMFATENDAKRARNMMRYKGIECGHNIFEIFIDESYVNQGEEADDDQNLRQG